jgi:DNA-directed RNA polymerase
MFFALKCIFNSFMGDASPLNTAIKIGRMIEDEIRFSKFQEKNKDYYNAIIKDFKRKGTSDYRFMHRVLTHKANEHQDEWVAWDQRSRAEVGMRLLHIVLAGTDLLKKTELRVKNKLYVLLEPTDTAKEWIDKHTELNSILFPERMPCIIPPDPWTSINQGGYYSPELRNTTPLLKTYDKKQTRLVAKADMSKVMSAVNQIQSTAWELNSEVYDVARSVWAMNLGIGMPFSEKLVPPPSPVVGIPVEDLTEKQAEALKMWKREASEIYTQERERMSKSFQISRIMRLAREYSEHSAFWFVWYCDFRGRLYTATSGFSPQGPDLAKGLLRFKEAKPLGDRGLYWLKVHGANRYGYDKGSYDERAAWVDEREAELLRAANDPLSYRDLWANADKPYQFLAFLFEYRDALAAAALGVDFMSHLPVGLDGSCNGLQNFSAMLRDQVGGKATNLVPQSRPADIYSQVARVCTDRLRAIQDSSPEARDWLRYCDKYGSGSIPRSMAKRPVMTLPYGATRQSCTKYIYLSLTSTDRDFFESSFAAACWLTPHLWASIGDVVVAAKDAMQWLQASASVLSKANEPITWITPDGFPAYQGTTRIETVQIETQLAGRFQVRIGSFTDYIDAAKQRLAISPNFVHSMDATHLRETVRLATERGITSLALIHDDYGTHACQTDALHECIREAFVGIYGGTDPLQALKDRTKAVVGLDLPELPQKGTLDIEAVRKSEFFFG